MLYRFTVDIAIPSVTYEAIPIATKTAFRDSVRALKALAVKINEGKPNEEVTIRAVWHKCHHDTDDKSCEAEQEI